MALRGAIRDRARRGDDDGMIDIAKMREDMANQRRPSNLLRNGTAVFSDYESYVGRNATETPARISAAMMMQISKGTTLDSLIGKGIGLQIIHKATA